MVNGIVHKCNGIKRKEIEKDLRNTIHRDKRVRLYVTWKKDNTFFNWRFHYG